MEKEKKIVIIDGKEVEVTVYDAAYAVGYGYNNHDEDYIDETCKRTD